MKKKIISILCALVMSVAMTEPIFAASTSDIYTAYKQTDDSLASLGPLFEDAEKGYSAFELPSTAPTSKQSHRSMIALEAWQKGFENPDGFDGVKENITEAAAKLASTLQAAESEANSLTGVSSTSIPNAANVQVTDPENIFTVDGKEFMILKSEGQGDDQMFYVMARDSYGMALIDGSNLGRWDDTLSNAIPYKFANSMALGTLTTDVTDTLPEDILRHIDAMHVWHIEPNANQTTGSKVVAPLSLISVSEYAQYINIIGKTEQAYTDWTRTPVKSNIQTHFTVSENTLSVANTYKSWNRLRIRPVFYLKASFFREVKMDKCGRNITKYLDEFMTLQEVEDLYGNDKDEVFEPYTITPAAIVGNPVVGDILTAGYTYTVAPQSVEIVWEKSLDGEEWEDANGTNSKNYEVKSADAGYQIRAKFIPTFDSVILKNGAIAYSQATDPVYTDIAIRNAVKEVNDATDTDELRTALMTHYPLFKLEYGIEALSNEAATIFMQDEVNSKDEVVLLYEQSIKLNEFANASGDDVVTLANYFLDSIDAYSKITDEAKKTTVITNLFNLTDEKGKVSAFVNKAVEFVMLERFSNAERKDVVELLREYSEELGVNISGLSTYQLEIAGAYLAGVDYGTNIELLKANAQKGVAEARNTTSPKNPVEDDTEDYPSGGVIPPVTEKPLPSGTEAESKFSDLDNVPWSITAIDALAEKGILAGNGDGTFSPDRFVTRNEFVKMIVTAFDIEMSDGELSYTDIAPDAWSAEYILAATNAGIISGITDTTFGDGMNITRQDVAVISERLMQYKDLAMQASSLTFVDSNEIADYAVTAVAKMSYNKIMNGLDGNRFAPKDSTTRAMAAVVVYNLLSYYESNTKVDTEYDEPVNIKSHNDKYAIVYDLGILSDEIIKDGRLTRGELAAALAVLGSYSLTGNDKSFDDVAASHQYYKQIEAVYRNNIMAGRTEKLFKPDEIATYKEAYEAIIALSGYTTLPSGRAEADRVLNKEAIFARDTDELSETIAKKLFYAALEIPVFDVSSKTSVKLSEKNILNTNFDVYKEKGVLNAVSGISIGGRGELADDKIIITVDSKDYLYSGNNYDYTDYLGCKVTYYYREADDSTYQVLGMTLSNTDIAPLTLSFEKIADAEKDLSALEYEVGNKTKKAKIARNAEFIYNGKRTYVVTSDDLTPDNGYITLIDTDDNGEYDIVKIENYEYIMIAQVDIKANTILDKFSWETYGFEEGVDAEKIKITKNGRYIKMEYLSQGDVLAIAKSRDGKVMNVYVSDKKVTGMLQSVYRDDYEIKINNQTLRCVHDVDLDGIANAMTITVGLDWNGYVVGYYTELGVSESAFGYLYYLGRDDAGDALTFKMLTQNNELVTLSTAQKFVMNNASVSTQDVIDELCDLVDHDGLASTEAKLMVKPQLIAYNLNADGDINKIYVSNTPQGVPDTQNEPLVLNKKYGGEYPTSPEVIYNSFGMTFGLEYNLLNKGIMFNITINGYEVDESRSSVTTISSKPISQNSTPEKISIYNADSSKISSLCVYEHGTPAGNSGAFREDFNTQALVVSQVISKYNEDEAEMVTALRGYHAGNQVEYILSPNLAEAPDNIDFTKIKSGDVLLIWLSGSEITRFRRVHAEDISNAMDNMTDQICTYANGSYSYGGSSYPYGIAQYFIERLEKGSGQLASTRWASAYGRIKHIYKSELYPYPVIKCVVAGNTDENATAFTMDSGTKAYVYSRSKGTIRVIETDGINISDVDAVITVRYGNVKDVIIYED